MVNIFLKEVTIKNCVTINFVMYLLKPIIWEANIDEISRD